MSDDIFAEIAGQLRPGEQTRDELLRTIAAEEAGWPGPDADTRVAPAPAKTAGRWPMLGWVAAAALALVAGIALVPRLTPAAMEVADPPQVGAARPAGLPDDTVGGADEIDEPEPVAAAASDYATLYAARPQGCRTMVRRRPGRGAHRCRVGRRPRAGAHADGGRGGGFGGGQWLL